MVTYPLVGCCTEFITIPTTGNQVFSTLWGCDKNMTRQTSRRDFLRKSAFAAGAMGLAAATMPGTSLAGCTVDGCSRTPGYWKNHPESWHYPDMEPITHLEIGCETYSKKELLYYLRNVKPKGNKMPILVRALIAAKLNIAGGVNDKCLDDDHFDFLHGKDVVYAADQWVCANGGIDKRVKHWNDVELLYPYEYKRAYVDDNELLYTTLDRYNNGLLPCTCPSD